MPNFAQGSPATVEYWNERVRNAPNEKDMLFLDGRREEYWRRVREQLLLWKDRQVLDVACGYGQFADIFENYVGIDFSSEMLNLAIKKHPKKRFICADVKTDSLAGFSGDIIFEVNSLRSLEMTPEQFYERCKPHAKEFVACLEADVFTIYPIYDL